MDTLEERALEFVARCEDQRSLKDLVEDFTELIQWFGFNHYVMAGLPSYGEDPESLVVVNKWPVEWLNRYREQSYFYPDPVTQSSFSQTRPFTWRNARERVIKNAKTKCIEGEAKDFGMVDGIGFPMADPDHWQAIVSLAMDRRCMLDSRQRGLIYLASTLCQGQAMELLRGERFPRPELSAREREILTWAAHGKQIWDISVILGIAESTVEKHLNHSRTKLHASNTTQAVARAVQTRQIRL